ncbi:MAG: hypothetical protein ACXVCD_19020 [Pseudobdellovibrionaceae bacterium]
MLSKSLLILAIMSLEYSNLSIAQASPDRIGNGGGVWVCEDSHHTVYDIMFMAVFEARREYQLNLPEVQHAPLDTVQLQKKWIEKFLNDPHNIIKHIEYVEKNITWIDDVINLIPDGANKISPHPSTCKQGDWNAVQLVNFTDDFRILVRRELFDSPFMSNLEKAAVYLHEGIYSYLRTEFSDTNSVRARAIVGFLLSNLPDNEKLVRIQKVLKQVVDNPEPQPTTSWMCGIKPDTYTALYVYEAPSADKAREGALNACIKGENPMEHIPGLPGFPQFPGGDFGPQSKCKENKIYCEAITSSKKSKNCTLTTIFGNKTYTGTGRSQLEAQKEAISLCLATEGDEHRCYDPSQIVCN